MRSSMAIPGALCMLPGAVYRKNRNLVCPLARKRLWKVGHNLVMFLVLIRIIPVLRLTKADIMLPGLASVSVLPGWISFTRR